MNLVCDSRAEAARFFCSCSRSFLLSLSDRDSLKDQRLYKRRPISFVLIEVWKKKREKGGNKEAGLSEIDWTFSFMETDNVDLIWVFLSFVRRRCLHYVDFHYVYVFTLQKFAIYTSLHCINFLYVNLNYTSTGLGRFRSWNTHNRMKPIIHIVLWEIRCESCDSKICSSNPHKQSQYCYPTVWCGAILPLMHRHYYKVRSSSDSVPSRVIAGLSGLNLKIKPLSKVLGQKITD